MRMYDVIAKKRDGFFLSASEIEFFVKGYTNGMIPDYQASALMMAIYINGMSAEETAVLTKCMAESGDQVDLSSISGIKVDKHSTGGVGDKTTLIVAPVVASCGVKVAKMSGRGLGHTGGTIDKLESIDGFKTTLSRDSFFDTVNRIGVSVIGQSGNLAPADKKLYALRDVTATVESIPLIASSIMSKKLAAGSDCILLDVKTGSGAFMKTIDDSIKLASAMVEIGEQVGRNTIALITNMDTPLGKAIGNALEVIEAVDTLHGHGSEDLTAVCIALAANMLYLAKKGTVEQCTQMAKEAISSGKAFECFCAMVSAQGGDERMLRNTSLFKKAEKSYPFTASHSGIISSMDTEGFGAASVLLGAGREKKEDSIDYSAGIVLHKKVGSEVRQGEVIADLYYSSSCDYEKAVDTLNSSIEIAENPDTVTIENKKLVLARVSRDAVDIY